MGWVASPSVPRPPAARAKLLDAFATILIEQGERAATIEAVATAAGVSKGGLLYHFGSKDALVEGLLERLNELATADVAAMRVAPEGAAAYYVRTSNFQNSQLDRAIIAAARLSQGENTAAQQALRDSVARMAWAGRFPESRKWGRDAQRIRMAWELLRP